MKRRDIYMNHKQQVIFYAGARHRRLVGSRRFGKTDGSLGPYILKVTMSQPRATFILLCTSKSQGFTRTVPGMLAAVARFGGLVEGIHFGWGRPPKDVPPPILKPKTWDNVLWFANGAIWQIVSLATPGSANGITCNAILADECKFMNKGKIDGEVMPCLSGITHPDNDIRFSEHNPLYKSTFFASDASLTQKGNWLEKEEEKMDLEIEDGAYKGKTYRWLQEQLDGYAERVIHWNDFLYNAKKDRIQPVLVSIEEKERITALAEAIREHSGPFHILPNHGDKITKNQLDMCVNYGILTPDDAELVMAHKYLITFEEDLEMQRLQGDKRLLKKIQRMQCDAFAFYHASTIDNLDILGHEYILRMKRDLPPVVFCISILGMKMKKSNEGFYFNLDVDNVHGYIPDDCQAIDKSYTKKIASGVLNGQQINREYETPDFDVLQNVKNCTKDGDLRDDLPLHIGFDYNAHINWLVTSQQYNNTGVEAMNVLSSMFVKNERMLQDLCEDWCRYYEPHRSHNRRVFYYYDQTAKFRSYATGGEDFKDTIIRILRKHGWDVVPVDMGAAPEHEKKHKVINECLAGIAYPAIRFNRLNNEALLIAMENTGIQQGYKGFRKDKSGEKLAEGMTRADGTDPTPYELRTDGTDAFDSLFWGVKFHRASMVGFCMPRR